MADQWYAVFEKGTTGATNDPVSVGTIIDEADLAEQGRLWVVLPADPTGQVWDRATQAFVAAPVVPKPLPRLKFIQRFTAAEFMAIRASADPEVQFFLYQMESSPTVTPQDAAVQAGLAYLVSVKLLTAARATVIGAD